MGKYSLDAFEVHPLQKLRPLMKAPEADCYRLLELHQVELEPGSGELLSPPPVGEGQVILQLHLDGEKDLEDVCGFIRRMGRCLEGGRKLAGVVLADGDFSGPQRDRLVQAYHQAFESTFLLAQPGTAMMDACRRAGGNVGLWLALDRGIIPLRRSIGQGDMARNWEKAPVYIFVKGDLNEAQLDAARRWHSSGANVPAVLGPRMTLRRMMFPRELTAGGPMPLRLWWQNLGTAPCYRDAEICLELRKDRARYPIALPEKTVRPGLGDSTFNVTAVLPQVTGSFDLRCGLRYGDAMLPLAMDAPCEKGMYRVGQVTLDGLSRPYLATLWEETYADGYYPLEDPAQPE